MYVWEGTAEWWDQVSRLGYPLILSRARSAASLTRPQKEVLCGLFSMKFRCSSQNTGDWVLGGFWFYDQRVKKSLPMGKLETCVIQKQVWWEFLGLECLGFRWLNELLLDLFEDPVSLRLPEPSYTGSLGLTLFCVSHVNTEEQSRSLSSHSHSLASRPTRAL